MRHRRHHRPVKKARSKEWAEKDPAKIPVNVQTALREAMRIESVPLTQYDDFL